MDNGGLREELLAASEASVPPGQRSIRALGWERVGPRPRPNLLLAWAGLCPSSVQCGDSRAPSPGASGSPGKTGCVWPQWGPI